MTGSQTTLSEIARAGGQRAEFSAIEFGNTIGWQSRNDLDQPLSTVVDIPPGIHLACGLAHMHSASADLGSFRFAGVGISALVVRDSSTTFSTRLAGPQIAQSAGFHLPLNKLIGSVDATLEQLVTLLERKPLFASGRVKRAHVNRLIRPIDPIFQGDARRLMMEARRLELCALLLAVVSDQTRSANPPSRIHHRHALYAHKAREILESELAAPPTLESLGRRVGLNIRSLGKAFQDQFGLKIGAYVTQARLELGRELIEEGMSCGQAAAEVGYHPAHFSTAFKRYYGFSPNQLFEQRY